MYNVFEHPWTVLIVAFTALIIVVIIRSVLPDKCHLWHFFIPVLIGVVAFGLDYFVETDLEKIISVVAEAVKAVEQEETNTIERIISDKYHDSFHRNKERLMLHSKAVLSQPLVEKNIKTILSTEILHSKATVLLTVRTIFDKRSFIAHNIKLLFTKARLEL
ncbi:MAG: hypothetical protein ACYSSI_14645, partial [Planctomycetota bacterium]